MEVETETNVHEEYVKQVEWKQSDDIFSEVEVEELPENFG